MPAKSMNSTIPLILDSKTKSRLGVLSKGSQCSMSFLASQAVTEYVNRETAIIEGIEAGIADWRAGRLVPHDQAMDELDHHLEAKISAKRAEADKSGCRPS